MLYVVKPLTSLGRVARVGVWAVAIIASSQATLAGVQPVSPRADSGDNWLLPDVSRAPLSAATGSVSPQFAAHEDSQGPKVLPQTTGTSRLMQDELQDTPPAVVIPRLHTDAQPDDAGVAKGAARAIPLPPAVQSGLTGLAALGIAATFRRVRRAFR